MRVPLAWANVSARPRRLAAAVAGIAFALLLVFMQLGSLETVRATATLVYDALEFDLILVSNEYQYLNRSGSFRATHLARAGVVPGVAATAAVGYDLATWEDPATRVRSSVMVLGFDPDPAGIRDPRIREQLPALARRGRVLVDRYSTPAFGSRAPGQEALVNGGNVEVAGVFELGMGFYGQGAIVTGLETFRELIRPRGDVWSLGLVRLEPGADPQAVARRITEALPEDVVCFPRDRFLRTEKDHYTKTMPLGILCRAGVAVALFMGAVVVFQVLATDFSNRLGEYATLRAAGFPWSYVRGVGLRQATWYAVLAYLPAAGLAQLVFQATGRVTRLPIRMSPELAGTVLVLALVTCLVSGALALSKVRRVDPAELF